VSPVAVESSHGAVSPLDDAIVPRSGHRRRRRHRRRSKNRQLRRIFSSRRLERAAFLLLVLMVSLGVAFWISHRNPNAEVPVQIN
jgi:hypothetical protein